MKKNVNTVFLKLTQHWKNHDDNRLFVHNMSQSSFLLQVLIM